MKFSEVTEHYINLAVQERIKRWQVTLDAVMSKRAEQGKFFPEVPADISNEYLASLRAKQMDRLVDDAQRAHKYKATHWLHAAIWAHCYEEVIKKGPSGSAKLWSIKQALRGDAGSRKARDQVLREVAKRYRVVDHAFSATVRRKDGTISRIQ